MLTQGLEGVGIHFDFYLSVAARLTSAVVQHDVEQVVSELAKISDLLVLHAVHLAVVLKNIYSTHNPVIQAFFQLRLARVLHHVNFREEQHLHSVRGVVNFKIKSIFITFYFEHSPNQTKLIQFLIVNHKVVVRLREKHFHLLAGRWD